MFITFEGGEGSGKSTQARLLAERLRALGQTVCLTREPGGCPAAEAVRGVLFGGAVTFGPVAELLLMGAARAEHVRETLRPALARGEVVVCDRFSDSTRVYQGAAGGLDPATIEMVNTLATGGLVPDLTLLLDIPAAAGLARIAATGRATNPFDARPLAYHERIRAGFLALAQAAPQRIRVIDASASPEVVAAAVWEVVGARLATC